MIFIRLKLSKNICISVFLASFMSFGAELALLYLALIVHEGSHMLACICTKEKCLGVNIDVFGINLVCKPIKKLSAALYVYCAGPLASFLMCVLFGTISMHSPHNYYIRFFTFANFCIGAINLLPTLPLDGGSIIKSILQSKLGILCGVKICKKMTVCFLITTIIIQITLIAYETLNISFMFFNFFLFKSYSIEKQLMLYEKKNILTLNTLPSKHSKYMAFDAQCELLAVAEKISHSYYLIVAAFDNGKFIGDIDETNLVKAINENGPLMTLKEYF